MVITTSVIHGAEEQSMSEQNITAAVFPYDLTIRVYLQNHSTFYSDVKLCVFL